MITIKINDNGVVLSGDSIKDINELTKKETADKLKAFGKAYTDDIVINQLKAETEINEKVEDEKLRRQKELETHKVECYGKKSKINIRERLISVATTVIGCGVTVGAIKAASAIINRHCNNNKKSFVECAVEEKPARPIEVGAVVEKISAHHDNKKNNKK